MRALASQVALGMLCCGVLLGPAPRAVAAPEDLAPVADDADDDDDVAGPWLGLRAGAWIAPRFDVQLRVEREGGQSMSVDAEDDLDVEQRAYIEDSWEHAVPELELFMDSRWVSLSLWGVVPFEYRGSTVLQRRVDLGSVEIEVDTPVEARFEQFLAGLDLRLNAVNNEVVLLGVFVGAHVLGVDWAVGSPGSGETATSDDLDWPLEAGDYELLPYPVAGLELRVGPREVLELYGRVSGVYAEYDGVELLNAEVEAGVTVYPLSNLGLQGGGRYVLFEVKDTGLDRGSWRGYDLDVSYLGATLSLIARF